ncbi:hypothetical protein [Nostoc sp. FACHB-888]|uniref:hypothetical protein n=1 Tax=Nostoc sp. FACHB-888 TaxID=2692842 RepID=UPI001686D42E|nr:hypothetical protein [Nostoc sp. FACHB-888]MBD2243224.1 hypothetical protein [Nostoc sp. FACHB-888]
MLPSCDRSPEVRSRFTLPENFSPSLRQTILGADSLDKVDNTCLYFIGFIAIAVFGQRSHFSCKATATWLNLDQLMWKVRSG